MKEQDIKTEFMNAVLDDDKVFCLWEGGENKDFTKIYSTCKNEKEMQMFVLAWLDFLTDYPNLYNFLLMQMPTAEAICKKKKHKPSMWRKFGLYALRWQLSGLVLAPCISFFSTWNAIAVACIANFIGACIFFFVDREIFKNKDARNHRSL